MYDKYSVLTAVTPGSTKLPKHKGLLIINDTAAGTVTVKSYDYNGVPSGNIVIPTLAKATQGFTIIPLWVYSVEAISNSATVYLLN